MKGYSNGKRQRSIKRLAPVLMTLIVLGTALFPARLQAKENALGLEDNAYYDIYIGNGDASTSIIRSVTIEDLRTIEDLVFLVIQTDSFATHRSQGLVLLSQVRAILPVNRVIVQPGK